MLETFLKAKPLFYDTIDYTRMPRVYEKIKKQIKIPKIIHLIGTNGKGTTGRFLATALHKLSYNVGHYTSPHILEFNERIWMNGSNVDTKTLNTKHLELLNILSKEDADSLSYFEYTTLLAMLIYQNMDYVVLEAGLGGEYDATAVFPKLLTLVTPIGIDHEAFLGNSIEEIARTKLNAIQNNAIMAKQRDIKVYEVAQELVLTKGISVEKLENVLDDKDKKLAKYIAQTSSLAVYLKENLTLAMSALKFFGLAYSKETFTNASLYGRLTKIRENVILDVGHNTLAANAIVKSLKEFKYTLVYNSYKDKNYKEILSILKPIIDEVELIYIEDARGESVTVMQELLDTMDIKNSLFKKIDPKKNYLVFGSFSVAEAFLREISE